MALTFTSFNSFKEVEARYNSIAPMRGEHNIGKDLRPIGDRSRKWERIVKISANCYALSDGYHFGDEYFPSWSQGSDKFAPTLKHMEKYAPIVWRKKRDGTEEVTLRNGWGPHQHNGRYQFLYRHAPKDMWFRNRNGKHYIQNGATYYFLAKNRTTPEPIYRKMKTLAGAQGWYKKMVDFAMLHDDNSALVFRKNEHGGLDHVEGTGTDTPQAPRVNKEAKAIYKDAIKSFFEWGMAMSPLLPLEDDEYVRDRHQEIRLHWNPNATRIYGGIPALPAEFLREVVRDEDHPMRLAMWVMFAAECTDRMWGFNREYYTKTVETKEDLARVRSRYNTWINRNLKFINK